MVILNSEREGVVYPRMRGSILALALFLSTGAAAQHSLGECHEGGDFIRNAALSRDSGTTRAFFVGRLEDELFLRAEVEAVFDVPLSSELHRAGFLERCARRAGHQAVPAS